jgi:Zn-dependent peptidase ImmA (M78 family)
MHVTSSVVRWAIEESGCTPEEIDSALKVEQGTVRLWARGEEFPSWAQLQGFAQELKRPIAAFFLPEPPVSRSRNIDFRAPPGINRRRPNSHELRYLREARRIQDVLAWFSESANKAKLKLPRPNQTNAAETAAQVRSLLSVTTKQQQDWKNTSVAFNGWRDALEKAGIFVFLFPLGHDSCRGFSLWNEHAPIVAANTHWNNAARIYTLFHEVGHLLTRSNSVCINPASQLHVSHSDAQERWCEHFSANLLIPLESLFSILKKEFNWSADKKISSLAQVGHVARIFNVSLRASALRLIEIKAASWDLYHSIPPYSDDKKAGGGGTGRKRLEVRENTYGNRATSTFIDALKQDLITPYDAMTYLRISDIDLSALENRRFDKAIT